MFDSVKVRAERLEIAAVKAVHQDLECQERDLGVVSVLEASEEALVQLVEDAIAIVSRYSERAAEEIRAELL